MKPGTIILKWIANHRHCSGDRTFPVSKKFVLWSELEVSCWWCFGIPKSLSVNIIHKCSVGVGWQYQVHSVPTRCKMNCDLPYTLNRDSDSPGFLLLHDSAYCHTAATHCPLFRHWLQKSLNTQLCSQFADNDMKEVVHDLMKQQKPFIPLSLKSL
jgi:hypothetical protein